MKDLMSKWLRGLLHEIKHLMESPEAQLRIAAAREMRKIDPPAYRQFLQRESKAWVREAARE